MRAANRRGDSLAANFQEVDEPAHSLGSKQMTDEYMSNRNMAKGARSNAAVHPLEPGVTGRGMRGRLGRRSKTR